MKQLRYTILFFATFLFTAIVAADEYAQYLQCGLKAIFRSDFPFVTQLGEVAGYSVPPTRLGNSVKLLTTGESRLKWRLELADRARKSLRIQTYIFSADEAGKIIAERLKKRRAEGLEIKLTIDTYTKFRPADRKMFNGLELSGILITGFEPWYLLGVAENRIFNFRDINMRYHEKYWIVDDSMAIVGGSNIANGYFRYGDSPDAMWRDQDVLLTGPVVQDIGMAFEDNRAYFMQRRQERFWFNKATFFRKPWWMLTNSEPPKLAGNPNDTAAPPPREELDDLDAPVRFVRHRPRYKEDYIFQAYCYLIDNAREHIIIENAYFVPNRAIITSLMKAAKRGVKVIIITNSEKTNDVKLMQPLCRYSYLPLMNYGVEIYEWQGDHPGHGTMHSKFAVFDGKVSVVGSCNLDPRSFDINSENVVLIDSEKIAKKLAETVLSEDLPNCRKIRIEEAAKWLNPRRNSERFRLKFGKTMESWY